MIGRLDVAQGVIYHQTCLRLGQQCGELHSAGERADDRLAQFVLNERGVGDEIDVHDVRRASKGLRSMADKEHTLVFLTQPVEQESCGLIRHVAVGGMVPASNEQAAVRTAAVQMRDAHP